MNIQERNRDVRRTNRNNILNALHETGVVTEIAKLTGLSRRTVYSHLFLLRIEGLVEDLIVNKRRRWKLKPLPCVSNGTGDMISEALSRLREGELQMMFRSKQNPQRTIWIDEIGPCTELREFVVASGEFGLRFFDTTSGRPTKDDGVGGGC